MGAGLTPIITKYIYAIGPRAGRREWRRRIPRARTDRRFSSPTEHTFWKIPMITLEGIQIRRWANSNTSPFDASGDHHNNQVILPLYTTGSKTETITQLLWTHTHTLWDFQTPPRTIWGEEYLGDTYYKQWGADWSYRNTIPGAIITRNIGGGLRLLQRRYIQLPETRKQVHTKIPGSAGRFRNGPSVDSRRIQSTGWSTNSNNN